MDKSPSTVTSFTITSRSLFTFISDAIGLHSQFAIMQPYNVVSNATAIAGPIAEASSMLFNILTKPIKVPIIPQAGPNSAHFSQKPIIFLCLSSRHVSSVSRIPRTSSGSVPSTISIIPFFRKGSSTSFEASSKARRPSFLATLAKSIIFVITAPGSMDCSLKTIDALFNPVRKSGNLYEANVPATEPPIVIMTDGVCNPE